MTTKNVDIKFESLVGKTLAAVTAAVGDDVIEFTTSDGQRFQLYHSQDCCDSVSVEYICGDLADLIEDPDGYKRAYPPESFTWTFYKIDTAKGGGQVGAIIVVERPLPPAKQ